MSRSNPLRKIIGAQTADFVIAQDWCGKRHLLLAQHITGPESYHPAMVQAFGRENNHPWLAVLGGGSFDCSPQGKTVLVYRSSSHYGQSEAACLELLLTSFMDSHEEFAGYRLLPFYPGVAAADRGCVSPVIEIIAGSKSPQQGPSRITDFVLQGPKHVPGHF